MTILKRNAAWVLVTLVAALLEGTWLDVISIQDVQPNLMLLLVVYFALMNGEERAMYTGAMGGVFQDVAANVRLGHHVLGHVIVGYVAGRLSTRLLTEHPVIKAGLVFMASMLDGFVYVSVMYVQKPDIGMTRMLLTIVIPTAFYTAFATPFVFFLLDRVFKRDVRIEGSAA